MSGDGRSLLLELPDELISNIASFAPKSDLLRLLLTCKRMLAIAEPHVYSFVYIRGQHATRQVLRALKGYPLRAKSMRCLHVTHDQSFSHDYGAIAHILRKAMHLKEFFFKSSQCSAVSSAPHWTWQNRPVLLFLYFRIASQGVVPPGWKMKLFGQLRSLTLSMGGGPFDFTKIDEQNVPIFHLPMLRYLKVSSARILDDFPDEQDFHRTTRLEELILAESNFTPEGLRRLLLLPKALKKLHLGGIPPRCNSLFLHFAHGTLQALRPHAPHLEELTFVTVPGEHEDQDVPNPVFGGFADFKRLEKLTLVNLCPELEHNLMSKLPPSLRHLCHISPTPFHPENKMLRGNFNTIQDPTEGIHIPFLRVPSIDGIGSIKRIDVTFDGPEWNEDFEDFAALASCIITGAKECQRLGVNLRVFHIRNDHEWPPVHGAESRETPLLIYSSDTSPEA